MSCSNPVKLYKSDLKESFRTNHSDFEGTALRDSFGEYNYHLVPCRYCLNCRIDRQNEMIDRCEYEYINYKCGAFVTFTYDDVHLFKNSFIDSKTGKTVASINKKDGKDFLNRLNKLVHAESDKLKKKKLPDTLCNKNYKYVITYEYGDKFKRPHFHCLFFGLDFAYCERLFWRAWQGQGSIQVGSIRNGGIAYAVKYIDSQEYGTQAFFKYDYHHLSRPSSSHSLGLGEGLYLSQLEYIKKNDGYYVWHNKKRPLPSYYKNKYKIVSDLDIKKKYDKYKVQCQNIKEMYNVDLHSFDAFTKFKINKSNIRQKNAEIRLRQHGNKVLDYSQLDKEIFKERTGRLPIDNNFKLSRIILPNGSTKLKVGNEYKNKLSTRDLMKLHTDVFKLRKLYGCQIADSMVGLAPVPF